jgi:phycocyanobilin lyase beta subunit
MDITNVVVPTLEHPEAIANLEPIAEHLGQVSNLTRAVEVIAPQAKPHPNGAAELANHSDQVPLQIQHLTESLGDPDFAIANQAMLALIELGEQAVPALETAIDNYENSARVYAIKALASIGNPQSLELLINCAQPKELMLPVRRAAIVGLGKINWQHGNHSMTMTNGETIATQQAQIIDLLGSLLADPNWSIRYAVVVALAQVAQDHSQTQFSSKIQTMLAALYSQEPEPVVKTRAGMVYQPHAAMMATA